MKFTVAHSPDSDDAYMMAPLALGWLDPDGFEIAFVRKDIERLNAEATEGRYDVTAISFGAYPELRDSYDLLTAGSSIQEGTGPLVVSRAPLAPAALVGLTIAIPGQRTSAYLSLRKWCAELGFEPAVALLPAAACAGDAATRPGKRMLPSPSRAANALDIALMRPDSRESRPPRQPERGRPGIRNPGGIALEACARHSRLGS